jgi:hypothetical protein
VISPRLHGAGRRDAAGRARRRSPRRRRAASSSPPRVDRPSGSSVLALPAGGPTGREPSGTVQPRVQRRGAPAWEVVC